MAKRKVKRRRSNGNGSISIINTVEGLMIANVWSEALFKNDVWTFLTAGTPLNPDTRWIGQGEDVISLRELVTWPPGATSNGSAVTASRLEVITNNVSGEWFPAVVNSTLIGVGSTVLRKFARKPIRMGNKILKQVGLRDMVRF
jgi:hypothetical protein